MIHDIERNKTPSQDAQGRWYELLSPTQVLTGVDQQQQQQQQQPLTKLSTSTTAQSKHRKCHGNRKAQRQRRKLRVREAKNKRFTEDGSSDIDEEQLLIQTNKRKRSALTGDQTKPLSQSLDRQLSISQEKVAKHQQLDESSSDSDEEPQLLDDHSRQPIPGYLTVPDHTFVRMLSKAIKNGEQIISWLDTKEKIAFIRQMARVTNDIHYFDLQRQLWDDHYNLGFKEGFWGMELSRSYAKQHRVCRAYSYQKNVIEARQMTAKNELQRNIDTLQKCLLELETNARSWQPPIDPYVLSYAIDEFVQHRQKRLRDEFDYKKKMLHINASDQYLIRSFYWLQPAQDRIDLAKKVWQTTADAFQMKQKEEILRKRISLRRLPRQIDRHSNPTITEMEKLLKHPMIDKDQRASLASVCSKLVIQYKFDLLCLHLQIIQEIRRTYQQTLAALLTDLSETTWADSIKQAIIDRQDTMVERYELGLTYKLNSFSIEAPMV